MLYQQDDIRRQIAEARLEICKCRQLCYLAACMADKKGFKGARKYVAMIKVAAPLCALKARDERLHHSSVVTPLCSLLPLFTPLCSHPQVIDESMQIHGAHGVSQDSRLTDLYAGIRTLRIADGRTRVT